MKKRPKTRLPVVKKRLPNAPHLKASEWGYIAGFFDGEGCVQTATYSLRDYWERRQRSNLGGLRLTITQREPEVLLWIHSRLGYGVVREHGRNGYPLWNYRIHARPEMLHFIRHILPHSRVKKAQLLLALSLLDTMTDKYGVRIFLSPEEMASRTEQFKQIRALKRPWLISETAPSP